MANICSYSLKVVGNFQNVSDFYNCLLGEEAYEDEPMAARIYDVDCWRTDVHDPENTAFYIYGSCAWSVRSAFIDYSEPDAVSLLLLSKKFSLALEFFSEECGMEFAEHYVIKNGEIITKEVVPYKEYSLEDIEENFEDFFEDEFIKEQGITKENYLEKFDGEDWLRLGGFEEDFTI